MALSQARSAGGDSARRGDPNVALLLTWFLPGAGHFYLGRMPIAVVGFLIVQGLYVLGWMLSDGRTFEFLDPELRGPFATLLTPEVGNLGAMIWQLRTVGFGPDELSPYPAQIALGGIFTALSGLLNGILMLDAHLQCRVPRDAGRRGPSPVRVVFFAWLVPGLGHWLQGRRKRAVIVASLLLLFFFLGTILSEGANLSRERHFYYWSGQILVGLPALLTEVLTGRPEVVREAAFGDVGLLYACMAGLLNVLAFLDVYGVAERRWFQPAADEEPAVVAADEAVEQVS